MASDSIVTKYNKKGLSFDQVKLKQQEYGINLLPEVKAVSVWYKLFQQFNNPLIYILLFALLIDVSLWVYDGADSFPIEVVAILIILLTNASLGLWQNLKAESALSHLKALTEQKSWVIRNGELQQVESKELVPGDVVRIEAGDRIPADAICIEPKGFMVDESILTGESAPVTVIDRQTIYSGTLAVRGFSLLEITLIGGASTMGKLATQIQSLKNDKTPLEKRLEVAGKKIALVVTIVSILLFIIGLFLVGTEYFFELFLFTVALAVAAVPESLPAVITLALALGVERMAKRRAVIRRMSAVEALGSVTVIATDKTGTLTENKMVVQRIECDDQLEAYKAMVLVNDADLGSGAGDPLETGILKYVEKNNVSINEIRSLHQVVSSRPFDADWKFMRATVINPNGETISYFKGAPEVLLERSNLALKEKNILKKTIDNYAGEGYRALAIAKSENELEEELEWLGLILLLDPPRKEIVKSIQLAHDAGIRVLMITGDHPQTAKEISRQIGIKSQGVLTGEELDQLSEIEFQRIIGYINIFARVSSEHKFRIVKALQHQQQIVAVTGDGVNDAPALKAADVGIAMGIRGSDVSREVADIVLLDDNFSTIIAAIEEGRGVFENIQKFLRFLFATNFSEVLLICIGALIAFQSVAVGGSMLLPLTAVQILWINLLTDSIPALSIAADKNQGLLLTKPKASNTPLFDGNTLKFIIAVGSIGSIISIGILLISPLFGVDKELVQTEVFCYLTLVQIAFVNPARKSNLLPKRNWLVFIALLVTVIIQILALTLPAIRSVLGLSLLTLPMVLILISAIAVSWIIAAFYSRVLRNSSLR